MRDASLDNLVDILPKTTQRASSSTEKALLNGVVSPTSSRRSRTHLNHARLPFRHTRVTRDRIVASPACTGNRSRPWRAIRPVWAPSRVGMQDAHGASPRGDCRVPRRCAGAGTCALREETRHREARLGHVDAGQDADGEFDRHLLVPDTQDQQEDFVPRGLRRPDDPVRSGSARSLLHSERHQDGVAALGRP